MYPSGVRGTKSNISFSMRSFDLCWSLNSRNSEALNIFAMYKEICTEVGVVYLSFVLLIDEIEYLFNCP